MIWNIAQHIERYKMAKKEQNKSKMKETHKKSAEYLRKGSKKR